jgi:hypothetical protein
MAVKKPAFIFSPEIFPSIRLGSVRQPGYLVPIRK